MHCELYWHVRTELVTLNCCGCVDVLEQVISGANVPEAMRFARLARPRDEFYYRFRCVDESFWSLYACDLLQYVLR